MGHIYYAEDIKKDVEAGLLPAIYEGNYYDPEINKAYLSFHTWQDFHGSLGVPACEAKAVAKLYEGWEEKKDNKAFLIGSYVDAALVGEEGELEKFREENPDIFTKKGELKADFKMAEAMIERCRKDELFMKYLSGEKQAIFVFYLEGVPCKCKLDSYIPGKAIVDLKTTREMHKTFRVDDYGKADFVTYYNYVGQLAFYQEGVRIVTGEKLPTFINAVSKSADYPEIKIIYVDNYALFDELTVIKQSLRTPLVDVWKNKVAPVKCGRADCHYCIETEKLTDTVNYRDLIAEGGEF